MYNGGTLFSSFFISNSTDNILYNIENNDFWQNQVLIYFQGQVPTVKFGLSEKHTKFEKIFHLNLT